MNIVVGSDHAGFVLKEQLRTFVSDLGYEIRDVGTESSHPLDYPDYAEAAATAVGEDGLRGVTSNPGIFEKAIVGSTDASGHHRRPGITQAECEVRL